MSQNRSHAVMAQRVEPHDSLDDFPTQPWATRALIEHVIMPNLGVLDPRGHLKSGRVWEPACNRGHMVKPLGEYFGRVFSSDVHDYSAEWDGQDRVADFLMHGSESAVIENLGLHWIITNPPFRLAVQFIQRAFELKPAEGVAVIVRTSFLEGVERYKTLFSKNPPSIIAQFIERVPMVKGRLTATGSTATAYCWLVWMVGEPEQKFCWIPPCRKKLERASDYASQAA